MIPSACLWIAFVALCIFFEAMCVYEEELDWQWKSGCLAAPVVKPGCRRWRVLSRQYEAYVRDQCWTVEITDMRRMEGQWGLRETWITGGLMPWPQAQWLLITHMHFHHSHCILHTSRGLMQSPMLTRLSPSLGRSVRSFVSRITTGWTRARLFSLFKS